MARPKDSALRQRLIETASREFAEHGFAATAIAAIGAAAGVTKGGVYFHFRGKEELFFAVVDHWRQAHRSLLAPAAVGEPQTLRAFLVDYLGFHFQHPDASGLMRVLASEMRAHFTTRLREDHQATMRAVRARIRDLLAQGTHDGSLFTTDPAMATFVLVAAVEGVLSLVGSSPRDADPFRHPESLVDFLLAPYETASGSGSSGSGPTIEAEGVDFLPPF
jgi:AcrR family transcriptional regulator